MSWTRRWVRLRAAGWPAPEDPDGDEDAELDGRELIADRLVDEVGGLRQCSNREIFGRPAAFLELTAAEATSVIDISAHAAR